MSGAGQGTINFELTLGDEPALMIDAKLFRSVDFDTFASAVNGVREALWPTATEAQEEEEIDAQEEGEEAAEGAPVSDRAEAAPGWRLNPVPGTRAHDVLALLREGVTGTTEIADRLDMVTNVAGRLKAQLIKGGFWAPSQADEGGQS